MCEDEEAFGWNDGAVVLHVVRARGWVGMRFVGWMDVDGWVDEILLCIA